MKNKSNPTNNQPKEFDFYRKEVQNNKEHFLKIFLDMQRAFLVRVAQEDSSNTKELEQLNGDLFLLTEFLYTA